MNIPLDATASSFFGLSGVSFNLSGPNFTWFPGVLSPAEAFACKNDQYDCKRGWMKYTGWPGVPVDPPYSTHELSQAQMTFKFQASAVRVFGGAAQFWSGDKDFYTATASLDGLGTRAVNFTIPALRKDESEPLFTQAALDPDVPHTLFINFNYTTYAQTVVYVSKIDLLLESPPGAPSTGTSSGTQTSEIGVQSSQSGIAGTLSTTEGHSAPVQTPNSSQARVTTSTHAGLPKPVIPSIVTALVLVFLAVTLVFYLRWKKKKVGINAYLSGMPATAQIQSDRSRKAGEINDPAKPVIGPVEGSSTSAPTGSAASEEDGELANLRGAMRRAGLSVNVLMASLRPQRGEPPENLPSYDD